MDEEDIADAEEARKLQTTDSFAGLGSTAEERSLREPFADLLKTTGETMGVKLLKKMGWREGQGVGPRVRRKARLDEDDDPGGNGRDETHLFAPENSKMISFIRKTDRKGLGFEGEDGLRGSRIGENSRSSAGNFQPYDGDEPGIGTVNKYSKTKKKKSEQQGGFGVRILNDNGSDDEDPYHMGPKISYNRVIGGDKKKRAENGKTTANPLLTSKPIFISKKANSKNKAPTFRRGHDGRLPLSGFILSATIDPLSLTLSSEGKYRPPKVPAEWKPSKTPRNPSASNLPQDYQSAAAIAKTSNLSPKSRAALLGETPLPGKSVFDFLSPIARSRIVSATNNSNLPPALSEASTMSSSTNSHSKTLHSLIPPLSPTTASSALGRCTAGWMPYSDNAAKSERYRFFLQNRASAHPSSSTTLPDRAPGASNDEWAKEMQEFAQAAQMFKPMTGFMATRFTSASSTPRDDSDVQNNSSITDANQQELLYKPAEKPKDPAVQAATLGMFGPLTRSSVMFAPTRLLCKRFNVQPPAHVVPDPSPANNPSSTSTNIFSGSSTDVKTSVPSQRQLAIEGKTGAEGEEGMRAGGEETRGAALVDPERNEALEKERPEDAVFRAIFGSDSEDE